MIVRVIQSATRDPDSAGEASLGATRHPGANLCFIPRCRAVRASFVIVVAEVNGGVNRTGASIWNLAVYLEVNVRVSMRTGGSGLQAADRDSMLRYLRGHPSNRNIRAATSDLHDGIL